MKKVAIAAAIALAVCAAPAAKACKGDHWVTSIANDGVLVTLDDQTVWEVDAGDTVDSALWVAMDDIIVCDDKLVNTSEGETVGAHQVP